MTKKKKKKLHKWKDANSNEDIQIVPSVRLLGITIDDRLNFNEHISSICKSAENQLNALQKSSKASINLRNYRAVCTEAFKTMIDLNPTYTKEIFERSVSNKRPVRQNHKMNLVTPKTNQVR